MTRFTSSFGLDPQIEKELRKMGPHFDQDVLERSRALFSDRKDHSLPEGGWKEENIPYGDHARQILDLCIPGGTKNPIVLFVPGGGFTGGDKSFYAHIPYFFARKGYLGVAMNYRLAPEFVWPAGGQDVSGALDWLAANAQRYGGNPAQIFLIGQSAGAVHSATALFDRRFLGWDVGPDFERLHHLVGVLPLNRRHDEKGIIEAESKTQAVFHWLNMDVGHATFVRLVDDDADQPEKPVLGIL